MPQSKFNNYSDNELKQWIENHEKARKTNLPRYSLLIDELAKRLESRHKLSVALSIQHLKSCSIQEKYTTYGELAEVSRVPWSQARMHMNGSHGHLDTLLRYCHSNNLPYFPAICVNQKMREIGKLEDVALEGFIKGIHRLGINTNNAEAYHEFCCKQCWEWGRLNKKS